ncbi:LOW QUALITY PROTEIN: mucin-19-like [Lates calcarifer]|uniref:LOW QUALITY PROTEIN: mucin-19-like n=1 Tax=Lates calcarifer TaxID=8187 RepID=A0AAJ8BL24_LATCA|nr:LOW QUALITY PROTEIN: mucin-19-like [Lates calcarifer]
MGASGSLTSQRWMLAVCFLLASVLGTGESISTTETQKYTCRTFGSGVVQPFNGSRFYVRSNCPFTLTRFTHNRVECDITIRRGASGLLLQVEIIINKIRTVVQNGSIQVETRSVSLPYDHTYQHIFHYGIYTKLRSSLLPLSVTWHSVPGGIGTLWVDLEQELSTDMTGLCGKHNVPGSRQQLITDSELTEDTCQTRDPISAVNPECRLFFSYTLDCLQARTPQYIQLCEENIYSHENNKYISCAFFKEVVQQCGNRSYVWHIWRAVTRCAPPSCPGDLLYVEQGAAFIPSCSNLNPRFSNQDLTSSCVCPMGKVLNDHAVGFRCVTASSCPCVFAGRSYLTGDIRSTKCQLCVCGAGSWNCSENFCPARCLIEGPFVTTFDGKQYVVPGKCAYVASQGLNWIITVKFSEKEASLKTVVLQLFQEMYTFSYNSVKLGGEEITELHQSDHALVFWQSSMYVQVHTSFGMKIQVQMSPEIQLYITPPRNHTGAISGLCGNSNNDTTDDFTTSSGIIENSPQPFALSWSVGTCAVNIPPTCSNTDNEIFADEKCSVLNNPTGIFAKCHSHIPTDQFHTECIQRTCNCGSNVQQCLCVALGSYAKACAILGVAVGDWREATNCTLKCQKNQEFFYDMRACNRTCLSLSGPDPRCWLNDAPVEGCGCPEGTHLNQGHTCTPKAECVCHYHGSTTPPGPVVIDGRQCLCENGELRCSKDCGCRNGKVCVHCSEYLVNTAQKTCDSLSRPQAANLTCESGCYCPHDQYEDHSGNCVSLDNCTCVYGGKVFSTGQQVKTNCKTCICGQGQWRCKDEPCPGKCQVYGNGHYQTFDSKWYRFDGHCQYTLIEDYCGKTTGSFSVRVESVPCCDEALTCSRSIVLDLQGIVSLTLSDMRVTRRLQKDWTLQKDSLYTTHTVGLYIIISVPSKGITLIWDKHTRITIELQPNWRRRVCGLCGNFDSNEMNDLQISGSAVVSSPLAFGNSWKAATPPCSDVTTEIFPCERNSYCSAWAMRRCLIIRGDTFKDCHLKVDPEPYYHACVQESCSCEFEGKFLGFCTAVAAYAEACSDQDVCVKWRTPDLCPVYCDYYNEQGQCSWHYEACGEMLTCGKGNFFTHKLEGCYPRCPKDAPYYDENTGECTKLRNCTCYFNNTVIQPGAVVRIESDECTYHHHPRDNCAFYYNNHYICPLTNVSATTETSSTTPSTTTTPLTAITNVSTTMETSSTTPSTTTTPLTAITNVSTTTEKLSTTPSTTTTSLTAITNVSTTTEKLSTMPSTTTTPLTAITNVSTTTETSSTTPSTTTTSLTAITNVSTTTETSSTTPSTTTTSLTAITNVSTTTEKWSTTPSTTTTPLTAITNVSTTTEKWSTPSSTTIPLTTITNVSTTTETSSTMLSTTTTPLAAITNVSTTTEKWSTTTDFIPEETGTAKSTWTPTAKPHESATSADTSSTQSTTKHTEPTATPQLTTTFATNATPAETSGPPEITITEVSTETSFTPTQPTTNSESPTSHEVTHSFTTSPTYTTPCSDCKDLKRKKIWACGDTWTEDCFYKTCANGKIELTPVVCPEPTVPTCPRDQVTKVSDGCCETWKCDCRCDLYGDPHYISFEGVTFDFLDDCTYILVEEQSPQHHLSIAVDNFYCVPGLEGSCAKGIILKYQNNIATLSIVPDLFAVQATLNNVTIQPPYEEQALRFETTGYMVSIHIPEIRSYVSLSPSYTLVVSLAMEHFLNNTQGQCGVCGGGTCIRRGGQIEDNSCCDKTAYDWVSADPLKPACFSAPRNVPCHPGPTLGPTDKPPTTAICIASPLCELLDHPVFLNCSEYVNLKLIKKNCESDSCGTTHSACSSLEQAAGECITAGICIDWRQLTNGSCNVTCQKGLVYKECQDKLDDFCFGGVRYPGASLEKRSTGCFCPSGQFRAGNHSNDCVFDCPYCKGPLGEPKLPGEVWESHCELCTCNNQTRTEECSPKPVQPAPLCGPNAVLVNTSCCGDQACVEKTCSYNDETYKVGDTWKDAAHPCMSLSCSREGVQTETRVCPTENCPEEDRIWDNQHCCFTCNQSCAPKLSNFSITVDNCTTVIEMPACQGQCASQSRVLVFADLQVEQESRCCQKQHTERRSVTLQCTDLTTRHYTYKHITSCECRTCSILR